MAILYTGTTPCGKKSTITTTVVNSTSVMIQALGQSFKMVGNKKKSPSLKNVNQAFRECSLEPGKYYWYTEYTS